MRKQVRHFPEKPVYALGIVIRPPWYRHRSAKTDATLAHQIAGAIEHPEVFYVVPLNDRNGKLKKIMRAVPEAQIYRR